MSAITRSYFGGLAEHVGGTWNRFWYTPADPLPLAVLRIVTGLVAIYVALSYSSDLVRFFGENGLLPPQVVERWDANFIDVEDGLPPLNRFSYFNYTQTAHALWLAQIAGLLVLTLYTVGYASRITSVLSLIVVLSYIHRAPMLTSQVEPVLAMLIFYLCLGPCGKCLSVDAWLAGRKGGARDQAKLATWGANVVLRLIQVHVAGLYVMIALTQLAGGGFGSVWWTGEAMWWVAARPESRLVDFTWIAGYGDLIDFWSHSVVAFELCFGVLMWNRWARPILMVWSAVTWILLALATGMVAYCLLMFLAGIAFFPGETLRAVLGKSSTEQASTKEGIAL